MSETRELQTGIIRSLHSDLLTSVSFNTHGTKLATASLDHSVRILGRSATKKWESVAELKCSAPVLKVTFAHPEFGTILASGCSDGLVQIWTEERVVAGPGTGGGTSKPKLVWESKASLTEGRGTIRDLDFCPSEFGLKLACVSSDSHLRIWESMDLVSLSEWTLMEDIDLSVLPHVKDKAEGGSPVTGFEKNQLASVESDGGWSVQWCKEAWWGEILAVCAGNTGVVRLFKLTAHGPWTNFYNVTTTDSRPISTLAWAPACGRSYQLLAGGSRDGKVYIWKLFTPSLGDVDEEPNTEWKSVCDELYDRDTPAQGNVSVAWNITGTVLSASSEDAWVRLWKSTFTGQWKTIAILKTEQTMESD